MTLLAQMDWKQSALALLLIGICLFLMLVILLQKGRGEGLAGAFGGGGGSGAFGAKTGDVFTWITVVVAALFILMSVIANYAFDQSPENLSAQTITVPADGLPALPDEPTSTSLPDATDQGALPATNDAADSGDGTNAKQPATNQPAETDKPGDG